MARQITILQQNADVNSGVRNLQCVFWFAITPANKQVPQPGFVSRATNVTSPEQTALESGATREEFIVIAFPTSYTTTEMKAEVNARYTNRATAVAAEAAARAFYAVTFDSSMGWSA